MVFQVPQLLELVVDKKTGIVVAKRGLYLSVIRHLERGLNFTAKLEISSNGGSTGSRLPNGTWSGIIGDVFNSQVDIGIMAAVTVYRYQAADICAPINFAFMGFAVGTMSCMIPKSCIKKCYRVKSYYAFLRTTKASVHLESHILAIYILLMDCNHLISRWSNFWNSDSHVTPISEVNSEATRSVEFLVLFRHLLQIFP